MNRCVFPILSRTGSQLPAALFIGNKLHSVLMLERKPDGYEAVISRELQDYLDSADAQLQGVAVSDLDVPHARPLLYSRDVGWSFTVPHQFAPEAIAHDLAVAALSSTDLWPTDSLSTRLVTLLAMGCDVDAVSHALFTDLLDRSADTDGLDWISQRLRRRSAQVSEALIAITQSGEFRNGRHSLTEPRGMATEVLLSIARHCQIPGYKKVSGQPRVSSLADYSPTIALTGGWWKPVDLGADPDHWCSYSVAIVLRPPGPGQWRFRALRSERDAGIAFKRWRATGEPTLHSQLTGMDGTLQLDFESASGAAVLLEIEADRFFVPSDVIPHSRDHRSLAVCFRKFEVVGRNSDDRRQIPMMKHSVTH